MGGRTLCSKPSLMAVKSQIATKLERLRSLSLSDWSILVQLAAFCGALAIALRITSWRRVARALMSGSRMAWLRRFPLFHLAYSLDNLYPLVEMATSTCLRNRCLVRSLMRLWLLRCRGVSAEIVLGVRKRAGLFEAHAWTVSERGLEGERPDEIASYTSLVTSGELERL